VRQLLKLLPHQHLLLRLRRLRRLQQRVRSSSQVLAHRTQSVARRAVDSNLGNALARLLRRREMEDVGLEMRSRTILLLKHLPDAIWDDGDRVICKIVVGWRARSVRWSRRGLQYS
jgi:hypothetical protein